MSDVAEGTSRMTWFDWLVIVVVVCLLLWLGHNGCGCAAAPETRNAKLETLSAGPQVVSRPTAAPKIEVKAEGPVAVEAPSRADTSTEAARPEVAVAPRAEVTGTLNQQLLTKVDALQESVNAAAAGIGKLEAKFGDVGRDVNTVATNFDLSDKQLKAFEAALAAQRESYKAAQVARSEADARYLALLTGILIALAGWSVIALTIAAPASGIMKVAMRAGGAAAIGAAILRYFI